MGDGLPVAQAAGHEDDQNLRLLLRPCHLWGEVDYGLLTDFLSDGPVVWHMPRIGHRRSRNGKFLVTLGPFNRNTGE